MSSHPVIVPVADVRRDPSHRSERLSQLLYGQEVTVAESQERFCSVRTSDGYRGWVAQSYLGTLDSGFAPQAVVSSRWATFTVEGRGGMVLPFGGLVRCDGETYRDVATNQPMSLDEGAIDKSLARPDLSPTSLAQMFLSTPYLWGGTSPYGFDCSGLVQSVYRRCGINLPRDSKDQISSGREIELKDAADGDLVFFPGHVAMYMGALRIIHATRLRNMVVIESLDPDASDFREDLVDRVTTVRRVLS
jgi:gamma-D-glutamyl-L-lysine dipeptidyl-peptidase